MLRDNWMGFQHFDGINARTSHWAINPELWSGWGKSWANLLRSSPFRREIRSVWLSEKQRLIAIDLRSYAEELR